MMVGRERDSLASIEQGICTVIHEQFQGPGHHVSLQWHNEPSRWHVDSHRACLVVEPDASTDFWQRTHYGFQADNGHLLCARVTCDFEMTTHVALFAKHQYDQAGLMVRFSDACWLKTSVEYEPEEADRLGAVVTNHGYSDWSTQDVVDLHRIHLRVRREGSDYTVDASFDGVDWSQLRMAHLHHEADAAVQCGVYACSPKGPGFRAEFNHLNIMRP